MSQDANDLRMLLDRAAIHDVLNRYYQGIDQGDAGMVRRCFTEDKIGRAHV